MKKVSRGKLPIKANYCGRTVIWSHKKTFVREYEGQKE